jgi:hypothetical protein
MSGPSRSIYARALRLKHLQLRPTTTFALFEGSIALGALLALADKVDAWGVLAVPVAVAAMVKLNDTVAGVLIRPLALAQLRTPRLSESAKTGRSRVPRPSRPTTWIDTDDALSDEDAQSVARGIATVPTQESGRRPMPGIRSPEPPVPNQLTLRPDGGDANSRGNQGRFSNFRVRT